MKVRISVLLGELYFRFGNASARLHSETQMTFNNSLLSLGVVVVGAVAAAGSRFSSPSIFKNGKLLVTRQNMIIFFNLFPFSIVHYTSSV